MEIEILFSDTLIKALTENRKQEIYNWIPIIATLGGALIGAAASIIPQRYMLNERQKKEAISINSALLAEIKSILKIIEQRNYKKEIKDHITFLEKEKSDNFKIKYEIRISKNYNTTYQANAGKIGLLNKKSANSIVCFYHTLDAIICDIGSDGFIANEGGTISDFITIKILIEELHQIAEGIC